MACWKGGAGGGGVTERGCQIAREAPVKDEAKVKYEQEKGGGGEASSSGLASCAAAPISMSDFDVGKFVSRWGLPDVVIMILQKKRDL